MRSQLKKFPEQHRLRNENATYFSNRLNDIEGIHSMKPTPGTTELGWYIFPIVFEPQKFGGFTKEEFYKKLNRKSIPADQCYPPLHSLRCFKDRNLRKGINYSKANWGGSKSDDKHFPVVSDIYSRSVEFPQTMLISDKEALDKIINFICALKT